MGQFNPIKVIALGLALAMAVFAGPAAAQATRTWVSGVGDDVNPCSRTAPCKTFAGAISKTAAGGEINCLDPAGYGAVTITKSIVIDCHFTEGGTLAAGNGIVINAAASDTVVLRGLDIFGVSPPSNGVRFLAGGALHIENCVIRRFNAANSFGISFQPSTAAQLYILDTVVSENGSGASGGGILIQPVGTGGSARTVIARSHIEHNANVALRIDTTGNNSSTGTATDITDSEFSGSATGVAATMPAFASGLEVMIVRSHIINNSIVGLTAGGTGTALIRASDDTITGNGTAVSVNDSSQIRTYGDNRIDGNGSAGAFTPGTLPKS